VQNAFFWAHIIKKAEFDEIWEKYIELLFSLCYSQIKGTIKYRKGSFRYYIRLLTKANLAKAEDAKLRVFHVRVMIAELPIRDSVVP